MAAAGDEHGNNTIDLGGPLPLLSPPTAPMKVARELLPEFSDNGELKLRHWRGQWMVWRTSHWVEVEDREIRSQLYQRLEGARYLTPKGEKAWDPNRHKLADLLDALAGIVHLPAAVDPPVWVEQVGDAPTGAVVACRNGLLEVESRKLFDHDPRYFNLVSVPFDYDPAVPRPSRWLSFLDELWPDDPDSVILLQQWFGYILSGRTDLQKIMLLVGPTRGGKGTIYRLLVKMIGKANMAGPTLASMGTNFGLSPLIGRSLAVVSDARLAGVGTHQVVERLLTISGEDIITIDRKYRELWTGKLPTRIMIVSNELPNFGDASGTVAHRFMILSTTESWLGREDPALEGDLARELPGVLNWSLGGLALLAERGHFTEPSSMVDAVLQMKDSASPMSAFVREVCELGPGLWVDVDELYQQWRRWCVANGREKPGSKQAFGRSLRSVVPRVKITRLRDGDDRNRVYEGIAVRRLS